VTRALGLGLCVVLGLAACQGPAPEPERAPSATAVVVSALPTHVVAFQTLRAQLSSTPEGGAAALVVALTLYAENQELGLSCLTIAVDPGRLQDGTAWEGKEPQDAAQSSLAARLASRPHVPRSCFVSATPDNGYALGEPPYTVEVTEVRTTGDTAEVFVRCSGAHAPRPVTLKRNAHGTWAAYEWSALEVGVRPPSPKPQDDDL